MLNCYVRYKVACGINSALSRPARMHWIPVCDCDDGEISNTIRTASPVSAAQPRSRAGRYVDNHQMAASSFDCSFIVNLSPLMHRSEKTCARMILSIGASVP